MAERVGFEPTVPLPEQHLSRVPLSATQSPLHYDYFEESILTQISRFLIKIFNRVCFYKNITPLMQTIKYSLRKEKQPLFLSNLKRELILKHLKSIKKPVYSLFRINFIINVISL